MTPYYSDSAVTIYHGAAFDVLRETGENTVDTIVTDPPYALEFMGKGWDKVLPSVDVWRECLRVAKPGAMLMAFGGTRTYHRLTCSIEDAGWQIRDCLMWVYGSGFPKSHDIGKAIDKAAPRAGMFDAFAKHFAIRRAAAGKTQKEIAAHFPSKTGGITGCVWNWENGANVPTLKQWEKLQPMLGLSDKWQPLIERIEAEREVVGQDKNWGKGGAVPVSAYGEFDITAPATDAAKQWDGWGTALKPAWEPIVLAMKPLDGTFAENVQKWGVGGLWIDGARIGTGEDKTDGGCVGTTPILGGGIKRRVPADKTKGRWPANLIHDGSEEATAGFPNAGGGNHTYRRPKPEGRAGRVYGEYGQNEAEDSIGYGDTGTAARFFYCAKASKAERGPNNFHPTVKPLALMRYLVRLTRTPTGGTVLDPFMGSGTTKIAARHEGRTFIGIDKDAAYCQISAQRMAQEVLDL